MNVMDAASTLPGDGYAGTLVGRIWDPAAEGPSVVVIRDGGVFDISSAFPTARDLFEQPQPARSARAASGRRVGTLDELLANTPPETRDAGKPWVLSPVDLHAVKAAGVTFADSLVERIIEERSHGDSAAAAEVRERLVEEIGRDFSTIRPGSPEAVRLKAVLSTRGLWSQYLEVGLGTDAEIFTKAPILASVGTGVPVGILSASGWNNPEPEVAAIVGSGGDIVGATLANDVNLRDIEGRSALLLPRAKDNNASCAIGPFVCLFDDTFDLNTVRAMTVRLEILGADGFHLDAESEMRRISRDPVELVSQMMGPHHQYPDGAVLLLGTMFAPVVDRDAPAMGFTHKTGDQVRISANELGCLANDVRRSEDCEPWTFGVASLMRNLAARGLL